MVKWSSDGRANNYIKHGAGIIHKKNKKIPPKNYWKKNYTEKKWCDVKVHIPEVVWYGPPRPSTLDRGHTSRCS